MMEFSDGDTVIARNGDSAYIRKMGVWYCTGQTWHTQDSYLKKCIESDRYVLISSRSIAS